MSPPPSECHLRGEFPSAGVYPMTRGGPGELQPAERLCLAGEGVILLHSDMPMPHLFRHFSFQAIKSAGLCGLQFERKRK